MSSPEKAVIKAMRRHQRDGRRFRDLLVHCACGWKSPPLEAKKGSNDLVAARAEQAKSFERHIAKQVLEAAQISTMPVGAMFTLNIKIDGEEAAVSVAGTTNPRTAVRALHVAGKPEYLAQILASYENNDWDDEDES